jgi:hypothetical protein
VCKGTGEKTVIKNSGTREDILIKYEGKSTHFDNEMPITEAIYPAINI